MTPAPDTANRREDAEDLIVLAASFAAVAVMLVIAGLLWRALGSVNSKSR